MPGYETDRFVGLSQEDKSELTCSICQDIFKCPVVTNCCLQTFCEDCINDWLETNNSCPYDRKQLNRSSLTRPPRILMNMLGKLKIRCDYRERGCNEVLLLDNLTQHSLICHYNLENLKICKKCLCDDNLGHDCVKSLLVQINSLRNKYEWPAAESDNRNITARIEGSVSREIRELKLEKTQLYRKLENSDLEKHNFLRTIQELSDNQNSNVSPITTSMRSDEEVLREARKHVSNPKIVKNRTTKEVTDKVLHIVEAAIRESNSLIDLCKNVKEKLNKEIGDQWHCIASYNHMYELSTDYESGYYISIKYGVLSVRIYKTQYLHLKTFRQRFLSGKINREIKIERTDMRETMISNLKQIIFEAIEKFESLKEICADIRKQMEKKFGDKWQCIAYHNNFGSFSIHHLNEKYIKLRLAELTIVVLQTYNS